MMISEIIEVKLKMTAGVFTTLKRKHYRDSIKTRNFYMK